MLRTNAEIHNISFTLITNTVYCAWCTTYLFGIMSPQPLTNCGCLVIHSSARNINKPITQSSGQLHTHKTHWKMPLNNAIVLSYISSKPRTDCYEVLTLIPPNTLLGLGSPDAKYFFCFILQEMSHCA